MEVLSRATRQSAGHWKSAASSERETTYIVLLAAAVHSGAVPQCSLKTQQAVPTFLRACVVGGLRPLTSLMVLVLVLVLALALLF